MSDPFVFGRANASHAARSLGFLRRREDRTPSALEVERDPRPAPPAGDEGHPLRDQVGEVFIRVAFATRRRH